MSCPADVASGPVLTPTRHPAVDEACVAFPTSIGPHAEALHHPGPETLQQHVRTFGKVQHQRHAACVLQVDARSNAFRAPASPTTAPPVPPRAPPTSVRPGARPPRDPPAPSPRTGRVRSPPARRRADPRADRSRGRAAGLTRPAMRGAGEPDESPEVSYGDRSRSPAQWSCRQVPRRWSFGSSEPTGRGGASSLTIGPGAPGACARTRRR